MTPSPTALHHRSSKLHSSRLNTMDDLQTADTRSKRNLYRVNYYEPDNPVFDQQFFSSLYTSADTASPINSDQDRINWEHFILGRISLDFYPIVDSYYHSNKLGRWFTSKKWLTAVITSLFDIHQQAWIEFFSATTRQSSTDNIASAPKKTPPSLVAKYYHPATNLRRFQKQWFSRSINSFASWTVDELRSWLRTAKRILNNNKLSSSSTKKEQKNI